VSELPRGYLKASLRQTTPLRQTAALGDPSYAALRKAALGDTVDITIDVEAIKTV
jgi:hypothetical protein